MTELGMALLAICAPLALFCFGWVWVDEHTPEAEPAFADLAHPDDDPS